MDGSEVTARHEVNMSVGVAEKSCSLSEAKQAVKQIKACI